MTGDHIRLIPVSAGIIPRSMVPNDMSMAGLSMPARIVPTTPTRSISWIMSGMVEASG